MSERLKDRGANVTGAARGIGQAVALPMASEGAAVSLGDLDEAGVKETARQVRSSRKAAAPFLFAAMPAIEPRSTPWWNDSDIGRERSV